MLNFLFQFGRQQIILGQCAFTSVIRMMTWWQGWDMYSVCNIEKSINIPMPLNHTDLPSLAVKLC